MNAFCFTQQCYLIQVGILCLPGNIYHCMGVVIDILKFALNFFERKNCLKFFKITFYNELSST